MLSIEGGTAKPAFAPVPKFGPALLHQNDTKPHDQQSEVIRDIVAIPAGNVILSLLITITGVLPSWCDALALIAARAPLLSFPLLALVRPGLRCMPRTALSFTFAHEGR